MTPFESSDPSGSPADSLPIANQAHAASSLQPFVSELSALLINMPAASVEREIVSALARIGEFLEFDRVVVTEFTADGAALVVRHSWAALGIEAIQTNRIMEISLPKVFDRIREGSLVRIADCRLLADDPLRAEGWSVDLQEFERSGARAHLSIPFSVGGAPVGAFSVVRTRGPLEWPDPLVEQLALLAQIIGTAVHRRETERQLRSARTSVEELRSRLKGEDLDSQVDDLAEIDRSHILRVLRECGWKVKGRGNTAERLGLHPSTLRARMRKLGIERPPVPGA